MTDHELMLQLTEQNKQLTSLVQQLSDQNKWLMEQLKNLQRRHFGQSSEQNANEGQLSLFETPTVEESPEVAPTPVAAPTRKPAKKLAERLNPDLVTVEKRYFGLADTHCPNCRHQLDTIGQKAVRTTLEYIPARLVQHDNFAFTYKCPRCSADPKIDGDKLIQTPGPTALMAHSVMTPSLITEIVGEKYILDVPLYRQRSEWKRRGWETTTASLSNAVIKCGEWLTPLYQMLHEQLLKQDYLHGDETPIQVLTEPNKTATSKSYLWLITSNEGASKPAVYFAYDPTRSGKTAAKLYKGFEGTLQCDGYSGYHALPDTIRQVGCWAHARRKFFNATHGSQKGQAKQALAKIDQLFMWERDWAALKPADRLAKRQETAAPLVEAFWATLSQTNVLPNSSLGKAVDYAIGQKDRLNVFLEDGQVVLSNNLAERSIKPSVMLRKNSLFSKSQAGAKANAMYLSFIESAKANQLDPKLYLNYLFEEIPEWGQNPDPVDLEAYLPWNIEPAVLKQDPK